MTVRPILALDLATRTGWAHRDSTGHVSFGWLDVSTGESSVGATCPADAAVRMGRALVFQRFLNFLLVQGAGSLIVYEDLVSRRHHALRIAAHLEAVLFLRPECKMSIGPSALKKWATGNGASKKPAMVAAATKRWGARLGGEITDENEADALLLLAWGQEQVDVGAPTKEESEHVA